MALWLALHLPHLPLELFGAEPARPFAVLDNAEHRPVVHTANDTAAACGVGAGLTLGAALSLCSALQTRPRQRQAEDAALEALALWAQQFTSRVHIEASGLLLEIGASLRLFGGRDALCRRVDAGLRELGYGAVSSVAPTPSGAWLLARNGIDSRLETLPALATRLGALPIEALELEEGHVATLRGLGLRTLEACLHQPRAGLARRLGPGFLERVDRALGRCPDPRRPFQPPARFHARLPLPAEVEHSDALLFAAQRLLRQLVAFLRARAGGVTGFTLELEHRNRPASRIEVGLVCPSRDGEHLLALLRERLERFTLPAPTDALRLDANQPQPLERTHLSLFEAERPETPAWQALVERLRARLGAEAVQGLRLQADHRPERGWECVAPGTATAAGSDRPRPPWLLPQPHPLAERDGAPWWHGPLELLEGPERIESGWWDGADAARDYFVARSGRRQRLWLFRDLRSGGWYLSGYF